MPLPYDASDTSTSERPVGHVETSPRTRQQTTLAGDLASAVLAELPLSIAVLDGEGTIVAVNEAWVRFGRENDGAATAGASVGINYLDVCRAAVAASVPGAQEVLTGIQAVLEGHLSLFTLEYPCHSPTTQRWFLLQVTPLPGEHAGAVVSHTNITERKRLEQRTQASLAALLAMAEALVAPEAGGESQTGVEADGAARRLAELTRTVFGCERVSITQVDPESQRLHPLVRVGWSSEEERQWLTEAPRYRLADFMSDALIADLRAGTVIINDLTAAERQGLPTFGLRQVLVAPLRLGAQLLGTLDVDFGGQPHLYTEEERNLAAAIGHLAAMVLQRERLGRERQEAWARELAAREVTRQLDRFLATAAHDIRSPVTAALGNVQLARLRCEQMAGVAPAERGKRADLNARIFTAITAAEESMQRLVRMTELLFDVARARTGTLELKLRLCDLASVVRENVEAQRMATPERMIELELPGARVVPVLADPDRLGQVLSNYLTNALKYSEAGRPVVARLEVREGTATVAVRDEGPGLPQIERERVWEPFYRAPSVEVRYGNVGSLGLGLHICRAIIERHGGQVGVEGRVGHGSTFWFSLPVAAETAASEASASEAP